MPWDPAPDLKAVFEFGILYRGVLADLFFFIGQKGGRLGIVYIIAERVLELWILTSWGHTLTTKL